MKHANYLKLFLILAVLLQALFACNVSEPGNEYNKQDIAPGGEKDSAGTTDRGPVKGGMLRLFSTYPDTLDPIASKNEYIQNYVHLVYESMVVPGKNQRPTEWLSDGWQVSEDGYTWSFSIREGVTWQDGFPLTAEDVEFTMKTIMDPENDSIYKFNLSNVSSCAAVDDRTIKIMLKKPNSFTPGLMTFPIMQKRFFSRDRGEDIYRTEFPPGTGPYSISSYQEKNQIILKASRTWWHKKINGGEYPYIPDISIKLYEYSTDVFDAFQMKTIDVVKIENEKLNLYINKPDVFVKLFPGTRFDFLALNLKNPFLKDKEVRQAIASSIDRKEITETVMQSRAIPASMPVVPGSWIYESDSGEDTIVNDKTGGMNFLDSIIPPKLEILVNSENELRVKVAEKICEYLSEIGIHAILRKEKWENVLDLVGRKSYDIVLLGCKVPDFPDISFLYSAWNMPYISNTGITPAYNVAGYNNELVNDYINRIFEVNSYDAMITLFSKAAAIINDEVPYIGLYFYLDAVLYGKNIRGELEPHAWSEYNNIVKCYIIESGD